MVKMKKCKLLKKKSKYMKKKSPNYDAFKAESVKDVLETDKIDTSKKKLL